MEVKEGRRRRGVTEGGRGWTYGWCRGWDGVPKAGENAEGEVEEERRGWDMGGGQGGMKGRRRGRWRDGQDTYEYKEPRQVRAPMRRMEIQRIDGGMVS